jgi:hypothetical protein
MTKHDINNLMKFKDIPTYATDNPRIKQLYTFPAHLRIKITFCLQSSPRTWELPLLILPLDQHTNHQRLTSSLFFDKYPCCETRSNSSCFRHLPKLFFEDHKSFPWPDVKQFFDVFAAVKRGAKRFTTFQVVELSFPNTPQRNRRE